MKTIKVRYTASNYFNPFSLELKKELKETFKNNNCIQYTTWEKFYNNSIDTFKQQSNNCHVFETYFNNKTLKIYNIDIIGRQMDVERFINDN